MIIRAQMTTWSKIGFLTKLDDSSLMSTIGKIIKCHLAVRTHMNNFLLLALSLKAGKANVTTTTPGLFSCKKIFFDESFLSGQQVKVLASVGHSVKSPTPRSGAAIWVENAELSGFSVCVVEYGQGSNGTTEANWIALQSAPPESQLGTASLNVWTTGTKCKKIDFQQVCRKFTCPS